jgi:sodium transport system permease protein
VVDVAALYAAVVWALTGAFYPAIDLCAGEKERGTLETLLSSPAERTEIVWGKLLTIMCFSMATVVLNIVSLAITGLVVSRHLPQSIGLPPALAPLWLLLALLPVSAFFSALCLALAAFARSTKEGQYYLMPLILITMPLVILSMSDSVPSPDAGLRSAGRSTSSTAKASCSAKANGSTWDCG